MFLIVFTTLMLSIVGLFIQVATLQASQLYHQQYALMQDMITWHGMAVNKVTANKATLSWATNGISGCSMTKTAVTSAYISGRPGDCSTPSPLTASDGYMIAGYNLSFYSAAFQDPSTGTNYVISFVYPMSPTNPEVALPDASGVDSGYKIQDITAQFMHAAPQGLVFGTVQTPGILIVPLVARQSAGAYNIPPWIPLGSVAIISSGS